MAIKHPAVLVLLLLIVCPAALAQADAYQKVAIVTFSYGPAGISTVSSEIQYGVPPHLDIQSGTLSGALLDAGHNPITTFSMQDPRALMETGDGSGTSAPGTGSPASPTGEFGITVPYTPALKYISLTDSATGTTLVTADVTPAVAAFSRLYPNDPDLLAVSGQGAARTPSPVPVAMLATGILLMGICACAYYLLYLHLRPERVLIVDDEKEVVDVFSLLLEKKGYTTLRAYSGEECLRLLKPWWKRPDLILLDVKMYPMDGWETLEEIKRKPSLKKIPVLMLTGTAPTPAQARKFGLCIDDYIVKPVSAQELYGSIDYVMKRRETIKMEIQAATLAGYEKEMVCEYARLRRRVEVDKKLLGILHTDRAAIPAATPEERTREIDNVQREIQSRQETLEQLLVKLSPVIHPPS